MNTDQPPPASSAHPAPPLIFALWSLRHRMETMSSETLDLLADLEISAVELAGLFNWTRQDLKAQLTTRHLQVYGFHGPDLNPNEEPALYAKWALRYFDLLNSRKVAFETNPELFRDDNKAEWEKTYASIAGLLVEIARHLGVDHRVSYHCFPHDFFVLDGRPLLMRIFDQPNLPPNLGLQLDTFWLNEAQVNVRTLSSLPVHSVHLNERDTFGQCCVLGTYPEKCRDYVRAIIKDHASVNWILENDPCDEIALTDNPPHLRTICECVEKWPAFWASLFDPTKPAPNTAATNSFALSLQTTVPILLTRHPSPPQLNRPLQRVYHPEVSEALTEFLFGQKPVLTALPFDHPTVRYYVTMRANAQAESQLRNLCAEQELFNKYWPPSNTPQVIQVVGTAGSGKSTLIRYFFQYYLPHREELLSEAVKSGSISPMAARFAAALQRHLVLYVDLRRPDPAMKLRTCLFKRLGDSLGLTAEDRSLTLLLRGRRGRDHESWLRENIVAIAKERHGNNRKYYITWVLDNADQLDEHAQGELVNIMFDYIPEAPPLQWASDPVTGEDRALWRIIVPIRPETQINLVRFWNPFRNKDSVILGSLDFDTVITRRAEWLRDTVKEHDRPLHENIKHSSSNRSYFALKPAEEMADLFHDGILAANRLRSEAHSISAHAKNVLDHLANRSTRRRLALIRRAAFSRSFYERYEKGRQRGWALPVVDFYFFYGLLCGEAQEFMTATDDCMLLNIYDLGKNDGSPHSIIIGLHAMYLLSMGKPWGNVRATLKRLQYDDGDISRCEEWLEAAEIIKRLHSGAHQIEISVVKGHWALLKEPAYSDNMAVACARSWGSPQRARSTDPLAASDVIPRFKASVWFLQEIWEAEKVVATFSKDAREHATFAAFATYFDKQRLPVVTSYVATEYLTRIQALRTYPRLDVAIRADEAQWVNCCRELRTIVSESSRRRTMAAQK